MRVQLHGMPRGLLGQAKGRHCMADRSRKARHRFYRQIKRAIGFLSAIQTLRDTKELLFPLVSALFTFILANGLPSKILAGLAAGVVAVCIQKGVILAMNRRLKMMDGSPIVDPQSKSSPSNTITSIVPAKNESPQLEWYGCLCAAAGPSQTHVLAESPKEAEWLYKQHMGFKEPAPSVSVFRSPGHKPSGADWDRDKESKRFRVQQPPA